MRFAEQNDVQRYEMFFTNATLFRKKIHSVLPPPVMTSIKHADCAVGNCYGDYVVRTCRGDGASRVVRGAGDADACGVPISPWAQWGALSSAVGLAQSSTMIYTLDFNSIRDNTA